MRVRGCIDMRFWLSCGWLYREGGGVVLGDVGVDWEGWEARGLLWGFDGMGDRWRWLGKKAEWIDDILMERKWVSGWFLYIYVFLSFSLSLLKLMSATSL